MCRINLLIPYNMSENRDVFNRFHYIVQDVQYKLKKRSVQYKYTT